MENKTSKQDETDNNIKHNYTPVKETPFEMNSKQITNAAINGVCPECGSLLRLSRIRKKRWFSNKAKTQITGIECPNKHDLDYNKRLGFIKSVYRDTEPHYDLSDYSNIIFENTKHKSIKIQFDRFYAWLSD